MSLNLDFSYMLAALIGEAGVSQDEIDQNLYRLQDAHGAMQADKLEGKLGFTRLPYQTTELDDVIALANTVRQECETLLVIGIGGSDLGARAVHRALNHQFYNQLDWARHGNPKLHFIGDTTDPVALQEVLDVIDLKKTILLMISKSGNTIEPTSAFLYARQKLIEAVGEEQSKKQIIALTDSSKGTIRQIVTQEGYRSLAVPEDVGGRFSVLSTVGLFPLAVAGVDIRTLLEGARAMDQHDKDALDPKTNLPAYYTYLMYLSYTNHHQPIRVLMPYIYGLREFGFWYRQLWAESLGKASNLDGQSVEIGPTPIASLGPTDQHSQLQLYLEGPINKTIIFITAKQALINQGTVNELSNMAVPEAFPGIDDASYVGGHSFQEILLAEQRSTEYALYKAGRPSVHLEIERLDAFNLGQLIYFFELAVTYGGKYHHINPFDQPAVEVGKRYMFGILGRTGYDDFKIEAKAGGNIISTN